MTTTPTQPVLDFTLLQHLPDRVIVCTEHDEAGAVTRAAEELGGDWRVTATETCNSHPGSHRHFWMERR